MAQLTAQGSQEEQKPHLLAASDDIAVEVSVRRDGCTGEEGWMYWGGAESSPSMLEYTSFSNQNTPDASGLFEGLSLTSGTRKITPTKHSPQTARATRSNAAPPVSKPSDDLNSLLFDTSPAPALLPDVKVCYWHAPSVPHTLTPLFHTL